MKHAGESALRQLTNLLNQLRAHPALKEKKPGVFYLKSQAFLHFHEDPAGLFADLRVEGQWRRLPVDTQAQHKKLLAQVKQTLPPH